MRTRRPTSQPPKMSDASRPASRDGAAVAAIGVMGADPEPPDASRPEQSQSHCDRAIDATRGASARRDFRRSAKAPFVARPRTM